MTFGQTLGTFHRRENEISFLWFVTQTQTVHCVREKEKERHSVASNVLSE